MKYILTVFIRCRNNECTFNKLPLPVEAVRFEHIRTCFELVRCGVWMKRDVCPLEEGGRRREHGQKWTMKKIRMY